MEDEFTGGETEDGGTGDGAGMEACLSDASSFVLELVTFVAEATGREPDELPPLSDAIDPEAAQRILASTGDESATLRFHYAGCEVTITGAGEMFVLT